MLRLEIFKRFLRCLHRLGARCSLRRLELSDLLFQIFLLLLCLELISASNLSRLSNISSPKARSFSRQARSVAHLSREASFSLKFSSAKAMLLALSSSSRSHFWILSTAAVCWTRCSSRILLKALSLAWSSVTTSSL